ncbi:MAG TPA: nitrite/sulfite reductase [Thermodesulfobacteriota bacterium]|nr:nitrite/sulfite reductase [Thermodesulfobacteriota bacterium]
MSTNESKIWDQLDLNSGTDVSSELNEYEDVIKKLFKGEIHPERFRSYRLLFGTYGVRHQGEGIHMQRIKIPSGFITSEQLRTMADVVEKYAGSGHGHLTTRQDIQLHFVKLEHVPSLLRELAEVGITTREACGNTVRNVTSSSLSGICPNEVFDTLPYALYTTRYFLRHPLTSTLPRKFKIAFSECEDDHAMVKIHDLGGVAQVRKNGKDIYGFKVYVGGGLGAIPFYAKPIADFVPVDEFYPLAEAIIRVFHEYGVEERKNRNKARIKFTVARLGFDKFKELVMREFERLKRLKPVSEELQRYVENFPKPAPLKNGREDGEENAKRLKSPIHKPDTGDDLYQLFLQKYTFKQKQDGYAGVYVKPPIGNLKPDEFRFIADLSELYGAGYVRITPHQKILLPWVGEDFLYDVHTELKSRGFIGGMNEAMREIVSCPGAFSCKLAVTHPYNLAEYIGERVEDLAGIRVNISGCPNSCGQHHVGDIGFYGASSKVGGKLAPHYVVMVGGNPFKQLERYGQVIGKVPAKNAHLFVRAVVDFWKENKTDGEEFYEFVDRVGIDSFRRVLAPFAKADPNDPEIYAEPGIAEDFKMEAETRGECMGSLLDIMAINLFDAIRNIYEAEDDMKEGNWEEVKKKCLDSIPKCARMYIYLDGVELEKEDEVLSEFTSRIVPRDWLCHDWSDVKEKYFTWKDFPVSKLLAEEIYNYTKELVKDCDKAFVRLQPDLKIQACLKSEGEEAHVPGE